MGDKKSEHLKTFWTQYKTAYTLARSKSLHCKCLQGFTGWLRFFFAISTEITGFSLQTLKKKPCKHLKCSGHFSRDHAVLVALSAVDLFYSLQSYGIDFSSLRNPQRKTPIEWKLHQWSPKQTIWSLSLLNGH